MIETKEISPSPAARHLFSAIVARADKKHVTREDTLALTTMRSVQGHNDIKLALELRKERWIAPADDGGIRIIT